MTRRKPSGRPWIAGAAGDVVVRPQSTGGNRRRRGDRQAGAEPAGGTTGRDLIVARREIHIVPGGPRDWIVRADGGREFGHYPSRRAAEAVGSKLARRDRGVLLVYDASGKVADRSRPSSGWFGRMSSG
jgi:Uncharacterized protein conserved in bacteria (DUF2188)